MNILAVRNDRFGEFLLNIPAFVALKEKYPKAKLTLVVNSYVKGIAEYIKEVDRVITWENKKHRFTEVLAFSQKLKKEKFDLCFIFNPSKEFNIISFLAKIPQRIGYSRKWPFLLNKKIEDRKHQAKKHEVEYNLDLVHFVGVDYKDKNINLKIDRNFVSEILNKYNLQRYNNIIIIHPYTSDSIKQWPFKEFKKLIKLLIKDLNLKIVVVGGKKEALEYKSLFSDFGKDITDLTGKTNLKELAALLKSCKLLVSGDSGPMHLAAAVGTKVLAIFRSDIIAKSSTRWGPWGNGHIVIEDKDINSITAEAVYEKTKDILRVNKYEKSLES